MPLSRKAMIAVLLKLKSQGKLFSFLQKEKLSRTALHSLPEKKSLHGLMRGVLSASPVEAAILNPQRGVTNSYVLTLKGGQKAVFKPLNSKALNEVLAYNISRTLGFDFVPPTVFRKGVPTEGGLLDGSVQQWVKGAPPAGYMRARDVVGDAAARPQLAKLRVFDYIIGNLDRHTANFLWNPKIRKIVAIDHGYALSRKSSMFLRTMSPDAFAESSRDLGGTLYDALSVLSPEEKLALKKRVSALTSLKAKKTPRSLRIKLLPSELRGSKEEPMEIDEDLKEVFRRLLLLKGML